MQQLIEQVASIIAQGIIDNYGTDAASVAAANAEKLLHNGDAEDAEAWGLIVKAIEQLQESQRT